MYSFVEEIRLILFIKAGFTWTGSIWNWYEIGIDKPCVYTGGSGIDRYCCLVPNASTYEDDPMWNRTVPV